MIFAWIMLVLLVVTGGIWLLDRFVFSKRRAAGSKEPWWVEYPKSFFPVILVVFLLRSFLVEPFKIPSGSMIPTLLVGDFILVNKFTYGLRLPIIDYKMVEINEPKRGDVMVFRFPENPSLDYIKRVVGVPGDRVSYRGKKLYVNGEAIEVRPAGNYSYVETGLELVSAKRFIEYLGGQAHPILVRPEAPPIQLAGILQYPHRNNCAYTDEGVTCIVPDGHYFVMGDNRDSSSDSRYWGFVPEKNIVGRAFLIWWNFQHLGRIGQVIQ
jgi:signal peptidase I